MTNKVATGIAILALVVAGVAVFLAFAGNATFGGTQHWQKESFLQGLYAGAARQLNLENDGDITSTADATFDDLTVTDDVLISGRSLTVTTSNTSTSTISGSCWQGVATSTATPIAFTLSTIATTTTMANGQTNNGFVLWKYGSCPF